MFKGKLLKRKCSYKRPKVLAHMMAFILPVTHCPVYFTTQVISADLFSHPKVTEMFRKSREINQIHFYEI